MSKAQPMLVRALKSERMLVVSFDGGVPESTLRADLRSWFCQNTYASDAKAR